MYVCMCIYRCIFIYIRGERKGHPLKARQSRLDGDPRVNTVGANIAGRVDGKSGGFEGEGTK